MSLAAEATTCSTFIDMIFGWKKKELSPGAQEDAAIQTILEAFTKGDEDALSEALRAYRHQLHTFDLFRASDQDYSARFMDGSPEPFGALRTDLKIAMAIATDDTALMDRIASTLIRDASDGFYPRAVAQRLTGTPVVEVSDELQLAAVTLAASDADAFYDAIDHGADQIACVSQAARALVQISPHLNEDLFSRFGLLLASAPGSVEAIDALMVEVLSGRARHFGAESVPAPGLLPFVLPVGSLVVSQKVGPAGQQAMNMARRLLRL